jgi:hypothetical protein
MIKVQDDALVRGRAGRPDSDNGTEDLAVAENRADILRQDPGNPAKRNQSSVIGRRVRRRRVRPREGRRDETCVPISWIVVLAHEADPSARSEGAYGSLVYFLGDHHACALKVER